MNGTVEISPALQGAVRRMLPPRKQRVTMGRKSAVKSPVSTRNSLWVVAVIFMTASLKLHRYFTMEAKSRKVFSLTTVCGHSSGHPAVPSHNRSDLVARHAPEASDDRGVKLLVFRGRRLDARWCR